MTTKNTPYKSVISNVDELKSYIDKEIGLSEWMDIDQGTIDRFGILTRDEQWIHMDTDRSESESPFGKTIAHGFLALSMFSYFFESSIELRGFKMGLNYGFDKIRFINVVPVGSRIRGRFKLMDLQEREEGVKCTYAVAIEIEGEEKPAIAAEWIGLAIT